MKKILYILVGVFLASSIVFGAKVFADSSTVTAGNCGTGQLVVGMMNTQLQCVTAGDNVYNASGTWLSMGGKTVIGTTTLSAGNANVTLVSTSTFTSTSTYICNGNDTAGSALAVSIVNTSAAIFHIYGTLGDTISYVCTGY